MHLILHVGLRKLKENVLQVSAGQKFVYEGDGEAESERERAPDRAITQPFGSDVLFSSQTGLDGFVPLLCYCQAEAPVVDHRQNCEAPGGTAPLNDSGETYGGKIQVFSLSGDRTRTIRVRRLTTRSK